MAILSLSGNIPVFITWFINRVNDFMMAGSIIFKSFEEIPSQLFFFCWKAFYNFLYGFFVYVIKSEKSQLAFLSNNYNTYCHHIESFVQ